MRIFTHLQISQGQTEIDLIDNFNILGDAMADNQTSPSLGDILKMLAQCCKCGQSPKHITGKLLPCGHVMCISCLQTLEKTLKKYHDNIEADGHGNNTGTLLTVPDVNAKEDQATPKKKPLDLSCPQCLKVYHVQDTGLSNLQSLNLDFGLMNHLVRTNTLCKEDCHSVADDITQHFCYECNGWMCVECSAKHCSADKSLHHVVTTEEYNKTFSESFERCPTHNERVTMFCSENHCQIPVCLMCLSISHAGHKAVSFSEAASLIKARLSALRKANKRRQESLRDNKQKLSMKLSDEKRKYSETKNQIELRTEELQQKLEIMRSQATEKGEQLMESVNGDYFVATLVDKLLKNAMQQEINTNVLLGISRMIKTNRKWFPIMSDGPNGPEFDETSTITLPIGIVDPTHDIMSTLSSDPCYKALLEPPRMHRSLSASMMLHSLNVQDEMKKYTMANHFVPEEIASYLSKPGEELSQLSVKHTTTLTNNDLGLLVGFYSSAFGWENGILVLSCRNASKTFKCKRAFSVRYQKHTYIKMAAFGSSHLLLADDTNRCVVTYTLNGKEVSTFSFSPNEVPRHIQVMDNKLLVTFRHEIKTFMINICGDIDGQHRVIFVLYNTVRGFEKENVMLEDSHVVDNGQLFVRGFVYPENTNRVREDPVFLNYRIYIIDEHQNCSRKVHYNSCADMYGVGNIALSPSGRYMYAADYNQNAVLEIPIKRAGKKTTLDVLRSKCLLSNLDGIEKLKTVSVDKFGDLVIVQTKDVKIFKKV
jgi:hypothetical protein